jgi:hypothetical protein
VRHTFCSDPLLKSADLKRVKEMIRYNNPSTTYHYSYLTLNHKCVPHDRPAEGYGNLRNWGLDMVYKGYRGGTLTKKAD